MPTGEPVIQAPFKSTSSPYAPGVVSYGVQSGRRSVILGASKTKGDVDWIIAYDTDDSPIYPNPENPEFYLRLKGCGMWIPSDQYPFPGITLKPLPSFRHPGIDTIEVRGTAFPKTATSDTINNPKINAMMSKFGLHGCNTPLGMWYFAPMENDPAPNIPKVCNILKTNGDRRYESNVAAGLEIILREKVSNQSASVLLHRVDQVYRKYRINRPGDQNRTYKRCDKLWKCDVNSFIDKYKGTTGGETIQYLDKETLISRKFCPSEDIYEAVGDDIKLSDGSSLLDLLKLAGRLGWEVGRCIAVVHRAGFDWGSYQDHSEDGMLDNAHANNIVLVPPDLMDLGDGKYQLLFPTDFDMSFTRDQAVDVWNRVALPDPAFVDNIFEVEFGNMMLNLGGYTAALEGVATGTFPRDPKEPSPQMELVWVMRDIAVWEYIHGYSFPGEQGYPGNDITLARCQRYLPEALEATIDVVP